MNCLAAPASQTARPNLHAQAAASRSTSSSFTTLVQEFTDSEPDARASDKTPSQVPNRAPGAPPSSPSNGMPSTGTSTMDLPARGQGILPAQLPGTSKASNVPAEPGTAATPDPPPPAATDADSDAPVHSRANGAKKDVAPRVAAELQIPVIAVAVPVTIPVAKPPLPFLVQTPEQRGPRERPALESGSPADPAPHDQVIHSDVALQLRLRSQTTPAVASPLPVVVEQAKNPKQPEAAQKAKDAPPVINSGPDSATETGADPKKADTPKPQELIVPPVEAHLADIGRQQVQSAPAATPAATTAPSTSAEAPSRVSPMPARLPEQAPTPANAHLQEPLIDQKNSQQATLRSVSLEFTPDGAGDVRLRLSERAGEVHISLHSQDTALTGRLHEGVHELVGSLSKAGYEADAWTSGQGRQGGQHQSGDDEQRRRPASPGPDTAEDFNSVFEHPAQEVS